MYSFGPESPAKFKISPKLAKYYNEAAAEWFKAQDRFKKKYNRQWNPRTDPINIGWNRKQQKAWNEFSKIWRDTLKTKGPFHENDFMDDFLVRNKPEDLLHTSSSGQGEIVSGIVSVVACMPGRYIYTAAALGALYGLLRGRNGHS